MNPRESRVSPLSIFLLVVFACFSASGCATFYERSYDSSHPPVYLSPVLAPEPVLSKIGIKKVTPDSPAASAGFEKGDEVLAVEDEYLYNSSRRLYNLLLRLHEERREIFKIKVRRRAEEHEFYLKPNYEPSKPMLGMKFKLLLPDEKELQSVQFVKEEISSEGFQHETFCDFRDLVRVAVHSHLWGKDLLVMEFSIYNNHRKKVIRLDPKDWVVRDNYGSVLYPAETEAILHKMYDVEKLHAILDDPHHRGRDKAIQVSAEMNKLREDLNTNELKVSEIPPQTPTYGVLIYPFDKAQSPISVDAQIGGDKFSAKFQLIQSEPESQPPSEGKHYLFGA